MTKSRYMKTGSSRPATRRNLDYPTETEGSRVARQLRSEANTLAESDRASLFKQGMQVIYGGTGTKEKVRCR